jgi:hypothetical protein
MNGGVGLVRPGCGQRAGGVLAEEADEFGAGVRPAGVGIGAVRDTTGPGMAALVDGPALGQDQRGWVMIEVLDTAAARRALARRNCPARAAASRCGP